MPCTTSRGRRFCTNLPPCACQRSQYPYAPLEPRHLLALIRASDCCFAAWQQRCRPRSRCPLHRRHQRAAVVLDRRFQQFFCRSICHICLSIRRGLTPTCPLLSHSTLPPSLVASGMTLADARRFLLLAFPSPLSDSPACNGSSIYDPLLSLPTSFDARMQWPGLFHPSPNPPSQCDPIAFVSATIFSDVVSIARNTKLTFSVQELLSCGGYSCDSGGWPNKAFLYMTEKGLPSEACYPFSGSEISKARMPASSAFTEASSSLPAT
jgi:hypothetical protein